MRSPVVARQEQPPAGMDSASFSASTAQRIRPRSFGPVDAAILAGSALSSFCLMWLVFFQLAPLSGALGFGLSWFGTFVLTYWLVVRELEGRRAATDKAVSLVISAGALLLIVPLVLIALYTTARGLKALSGHFFTQTEQFAGPLDAAKGLGGAAHAVVGTLEQVGLAVVISVPLGMLTAVFLNEVGGALKRPVRLFVDAMSGVPSIVAGLFIYTIWIVQFHRGFSGIAAALALSILMLPTVTRTAEEVLRLVPDGLREASLAVGSTEWRTTWRVVLPTAKSGLITAVLLGVARAVGETAPLIVTSLGSSVMNANPFHGPQESLPHFIYTLYRSDFTAQQNQAWTGALVLIALVLALFVSARILGSRRPGRGKVKLEPEVDLARIR